MVRLPEPHEWIAAGQQRATSPRGLPSLQSLHYWQTLLVTVAIGGLAVYLTARAVQSGPAAVLQAARKRVGV